MKERIENIPCPVCGRHIFERASDYAMCPVCDWENDGTEYSEYSSANHMTLVEACKNYKKFGWIYHEPPHHGDYSY